MRRTHGTFRDSKLNDQTAENRPMKNVGTGLEGNDTSRLGGM